MVIHDFVPAAQIIEVIINCITHMNILVNNLLISLLTKCLLIPGGGVATLDYVHWEIGHAII
jgi:hypothetical protein